MGLTVHPVLFYGVILTREDISNCLEVFFGEGEKFTTDVEIKAGLEGLNHELHKKFNVHVEWILDDQRLSAFMLAALKSIRTVKGRSMALDLRQLDDWRILNDWGLWVSKAAQAVNIDLHKDHPNKELGWRLSYQLQF
jgi:hypothetical protein